MVFYLVLVRSIILSELLLNNFEIIKTIANGIKNCKKNPVKGLLEIP